MKKISRSHKLVAIILASVILLGSVPIAYTSLVANAGNPVNSASSEDKRIASEISNETGVAVEQVLDLKNHGRSWNQVLDILKTRVNAKESSNKSTMQNMLLNTGLDGEFLAKLKKEGFSDESISQVRMLEERVTLQLQEITSDSGKDSVKVDKPSAGTLQNDKDNDDLSAYQELAKKIDIKNAIYFMLKLKNDFGSYEKVFDEYLYSLQLGIDLNEYIKDKKAYQKEKDEKKLLFNEQKIITLEKIEEKSIEVLQKSNKTDDKQAAGSENVKPGKSNTVNEKNPLPDVPKVEAKEVKPQNPTDEVMNEIKTINPMGN
ncbi:MAG TPA: hypothetical protein VHP38_12920 [Ruminiclostridium sp.]|nr:hypothetical protein [Ruminiclostridium sp.]